MVFFQKMQHTFFNKNSTIIKFTGNLKHIRLCTPRKEYHEQAWNQPETYQESFDQGM